MKKRLLSLLLVLCMMLSLLPTVAFAVVTQRTTTLTIDTSTAETDNLASEGWAWYPSGTTYGGAELPANTLVLAGLDMSLPYASSTANYYGIDLSAFTDTVNIYLAPDSTNTIAFEDSSKSKNFAAINCPNAALSVTGTGTLNFSTGSLPSLSAATTIYGINAKGSVDVTGATLDFTVGSAMGNSQTYHWVYGIKVSNGGDGSVPGVAKLTDATFTMNMPGNARQYGIYSSKIEIDDSIFNYTNANRANVQVSHQALAGTDLGVYISGSKTEISIAAPIGPGTNSTYYAINRLTSLTGGEVNCAAPVALHGTAEITGGRLTVQSDLTNSSVTSAIVVPNSYGNTLTLNNTIYKAGTLKDGSNATVQSLNLATNTYVEYFPRQLSASDWFRGNADRPQAAAKAQRKENCHGTQAGRS